MRPPPRRQTLAAGELPRHRHARGYLAIVLEGGYEEAGDVGRWQAEPGTVAAHGAFEAHLNRVRPRGATVLNLPLRPGLAPFGRVPDPDAVARAAERSTDDALALLSETIQPTPRPLARDWPDLLARALADGPVRLGEWAARNRLSPEHVSRGFRQVFGLGPLAYGRELRAQAALAAALDRPARLADIAAAQGFADQSHMTRTVSALTGRPPGAWRTSNPFKTCA